MAASNDPKKPRRLGEVPPAVFIAGGVHYADVSENDVEGRPLLETGGAVRTLIAKRNKVRLATYMPAPSQGWKAWLLPGIVGALVGIPCTLLCAYLAHRWGWTQ